LEAVGWYNPQVKDESQKVHLLPDRIQHWLSLGAEITDKVEFLMKKAAPHVLQGYIAKRTSKAVKVTEKRRERNKSEAQAAKSAKSSPAKSSAAKAPKA